MRILVTGGAGFIGSNFVHHLLRETDDEVVTLDALTYAGSTSNLKDVMDDPRHRFVEGDVRDRDVVVEQVEAVDAIVNFAAQSHVDRSIESAEPFVSTNVGGTQTLLSATRDADVESFVHVSTDEVYGEILDGTFAETDRLEPRNPYAATKAGADLLALSYHETHDLPVKIVRPSNNFGPRQYREKFIPKFVTKAARSEPLPLYGDGMNVREWTYVEDCCRAVDTVLRDGAVGEVYNAGSGEERRNIEVARKIVDTVGVSRDLIEFVEDRPGHDQRYALDTAKIEKLGWKPRWTFEEGLRATVDYYTE